MFSLFTTTILNVRFEVVQTFREMGEVLTNTSEVSSFMHVLKTFPGINTLRGAGITAYANAESREKGQSIPRQCRRCATADGGRDPVV